jgi:hypothetical protein
LLTDPKEITEGLINRNHEHFGQAPGTPFSVEPLSKVIDWGGNCETAEHILDGTFDPIDLHLSEPTIKILVELDGQSQGYKS